MRKGLLRMTENGNSNYTIDDVAKKAGGRFKLTVLVQKRFKELNQWALETGKTLPRDVVGAILREIWDGAIELVPEPEDVIKGQLPGD